MLPDPDLFISSVDYYVVPVSVKTIWIFIEVEFSDGSTGYGEASSFGSEAQIVADAVRISSFVARNRLVPVASAIAMIQAELGCDAKTCVVSAMEQAMLVTMAQRAGLPLGVALGGNRRTRVPVYANINRGVLNRSPEGFAEAACSALALGYRAIKLAPFDGLRWDETESANVEDLLNSGVERVAAVRTAIGDQCRLLVDCHWRFDVDLAARAVAMLSEYKPFWLEDLVDTSRVEAADLRRLRDLAHRSDILVSGGENIWTMKDALELLNKDGLDVILPDLRQTGILQARSILDLAAACGVKTSLHNPAGPVLDAISVQVAATLPDFLVLERQVNESPIYDALVETPITLIRGELLVPASTGLGVGISRDRLEAHALPRGEALEIPVSHGGGPGA